MSVDLEQLAEDMGIVFTDPKDIPDEEPEEVMIYE